ncbi:Uncharacterised protein [Mycobacterium xenopi]|uniref:REP13E12 repeat protein n=1 Tax=Mycobacterium xenopi TaxID=1789 RepID=A0AAD1GWQ1_MYCXE|nr:hypothetical protein MYXE_03870 [Mycobacterium xenopi]SPX79495.1 Uncharacterised protein [Mycobacterium xenopi]
MRSSSREEIVEKFDALEAALDAVLELSCDALTTPERFALDRCERVRCRLPAVEHPLINEIGRQASAEELGGKFRMRWPSGYWSAEPRPRGASAKPPTWGHAPR